MILSTLRWYFRRTKQEILLAQVDDFKEHVLDAPGEAPATRSFI
jgi:hypothetical protein